MQKSLRIGLLVAGLDFAPTNKSEVSVHFTTKGDLVADFRAHELSQQNTCFVTINSLHVTATRGRSDIDEEHFSLLNAFDFVVTVLTGTNHSLENSGLDIDFDVNLGHLIGVADNVTHHIVRSRELGINLGSNSD